MEGIYVFMLIVTLIFGILGLILFFKIWGMTENVKSIKDNLQILISNRSCSSLPTDGANQMSSNISVNDGESIDEENELEEENELGESSPSTCGSIMDEDKEIPFTMNKNCVNFSDGFKSTIE